MDKVAKLLTLKPRNSDHNRLKNNTMTKSTIIKFQVKSHHHQISSSEEQRSIHIRVRKAELTQCFAKRDLKGSETEEDKDK